MQVNKMLVIDVASEATSHRREFWFQLTDLATVQTRVELFLKASHVRGAASWRIAELDGPLSALHRQFGECADLATLCAVAENVTTHGDAYIAFLRRDVQLPADISATAFDSAFITDVEEPSDYAVAHVNDTYADALAALSPEMRHTFLLHYDYRAYAYTLEVNGEVDFETYEGRCYVFRKD